MGQGPGQLQVQSSAQRTRVRRLPSSCPCTQGTLRTPSCPTTNLSSVQEKGKDPSTCPRTLPSSARSRGEPMAGLSQQGRQQPWRAACVSLLPLFSRSVVPNSLRPSGLQPTRLLRPWDVPGKNTRVGCHFLLQGIFPTQGSHPGLLFGRWIPYHWAPREALLAPELALMADVCKGMAVCHADFKIKHEEQQPTNERQKVLTWQGSGLLFKSWREKRQVHSTMSQQLFVKNSALRSAPRGVKNTRETRLHQTGWEWWHGCPGDTAPARVEPRTPATMTEHRHLADGAEASSRALFSPSDPGNRHLQGESRPAVSPPASHEVCIYQSCSCLRPERTSSPRTARQPWPWQPGGPRWAGAWSPGGSTAIGASLATHGRPPPCCVLTSSPALRRGGQEAARCLTDNLLGTPQTSLLQGLLWVERWRPSRSPLLLQGADSHPRLHSLTWALIQRDPRCCHCGSHESPLQAKVKHGSPAWTCGGAGCSGRRGSPLSKRATRGPVLPRTVRGRAPPSEGPGQPTSAPVDEAPLLRQRRGSTETHEDPKRKSCSNKEKGYHCSKATTKNLAWSFLSSVTFALCVTEGRGVCPFRQKDTYLLLLYSASLGSWGPCWNSAPDTNRLHQTSAREREQAGLAEPSTRAGRGGSVPREEDSRLCRWDPGRGTPGAQLPGGRATPLLGLSPFLNHPAPLS